MYIAGPMQGYPNFNFPAFHDAAAIWRKMGYEVFNPAENDKDSQGVEPDKLVPSGNMAELEAAGFSRRRALSEDLAWIAANATHIYMLPGWEKSTGAYAEWAAAKAVGAHIYYG